MHVESNEVDFMGIEARQWSPKPSVVVGGGGKDERVHIKSQTGGISNNALTPCEITEREFQMSHHKNMEDEWQGNAA